MFVLLLNNTIQSIKILAIFPTQMKSHFIVGQVLLKELALSGHDVTVISPFKIKNPPKTYREITTIIPNQSYESNKTENNVLTDFI